MKRNKARRHTPGPRPVLVSVCARRCPQTDVGYSVGDGGQLEELAESRERLPFELDKGMVDWDPLPAFMSRITMTIAGMTDRRKLFPS